jgi:hypothetical protein
MIPETFEPKTPACKRPQTYALHHVNIGISSFTNIKVKMQMFNTYLIICIYRFIVSGRMWVLLVHEEKNTESENIEF